MGVGERPDWRAPRPGLTSARDRGIDRITAEMAYGGEAASEVCCQSATDPGSSYELQATNASV